LSLIYEAYIGLSSGLFLCCLPQFWIYTRLTGRYRKGFGERLGFIPRTLTQRLSGSPRIWIHAGSLGDVKVAPPLIEALTEIMPGCSIIISTTTEHGRDFAMETFEENTPVVSAPIDFIGSVRKALFSVRPDVLVFLETEIWPAWLGEARRMGIKTALINGRISVRSFGRYLKFRPFFREVLKGVDAFSMISEEDAARISAMGADPKEIEINGNAKYDALARLTPPVIPDMEPETRQILSLDASQRVFVASSAADGEEAMIFDAYEKILVEFPDTVLIIAPRHIHQTPAIGSLVEARGFRYQLWSELEGGMAKRTQPVVIINTFVESSKLYSVGTLVFCGASLVPLGGQNPLEAAVWEKVVFYGPSMENFIDHVAVLEEGGADFPVSNPETLAEKAIWFLGHPDALKAQGERSRDAVIRNQKAAERQARVVHRLVTRDNNDMN
jgi:3-deoxy-D-manno-octulosonic-acid transferase